MNANNEFELRMNKTIEALDEDFGMIRAGRANPKVLQKVMVDYYGSPTPINQVAGVSVPEARVIMIAPWEPTMLKEIEKAILASDIGITPNNDGKVIRLSFPELTEDRRKDIVKDIKKRGEEAKIALRNIRRDAIDDYKKQQKNSEISEDELRDAEANVQKATDNYATTVDNMVTTKSEEILTV